MFKQTPTIYIYIYIYTQAGRGRGGAAAPPRRGEGGAQALQVLQAARQEGPPQHYQILLARASMDIYIYIYIHICP